MGDIWASVQTSLNTFLTPTVPFMTLSQLISCNYFHKFIGPTKIFLQNFIWAAISRSKWWFRNTQWVPALLWCIFSQHPRDANNLDTAPLTQTMSAFADHHSELCPSYTPAPTEMYQTLTTQTPPSLPMSHDRLAQNPFVNELQAKNCSFK